MMRSLSMFTSSRLTQKNFARSVFFNKQFNKRGKCPQFTQLFSENEKDMSTRASSWMDRNEEFVRYESQPPLKMENLQDRSKKTEKQRRRRNDKRREEYNQRTIDEERKNFKENFRGTRVFVQGLPSWINWQGLKDHFKIAGNVVFASVSIDTTTGKSKGCGVVQFESTDMARNAIEIMRNHPLDDGSVLYVREDFQENDDSKSLSNRRGSTPPSSQWKCADEDNVHLLTDSDRSMVKNLIQARDQARRRRNFETSDNIRDDLKFKFGVHLDDRLKLWWVSADNAVPASVAEIKGEGRWGNLKPWRYVVN